MKLYLLLFFFKAKTAQPITIYGLGLTWELQKQQTGCKAPRIQGLIKNNDKIVGL